MLKQILNPDYYHGKYKNKNFFEGWYFKIVDKRNENAFAFIPGIIKGKNKDCGHSFIQVIDGKRRKSDYLKFSKNDFNARNDKLYIEVDKNLFTLNEIKLNYFNNNFQMIGSLKIIDVTKWPDTIVNPGSMGFYNYLLFMECYSQVCCLDGRLSGKMLINNKEIDYTGGKIYIEKNWGKKFPHAYIWIQTNSFKDEKVSLTCSVARIPLSCYKFSGFITAFKLNNEIYKFTTMNKSNMNLEIKSKNVKISFIKKRIKLNIETLCKESDYILCKGPNKGKMNINVKESIVSNIRVELLDLYRGVELFSGVGVSSGIEFMGNLREIKCR